VLGCTGVADGNAGAACTHWLAGLTSRRYGNVTLFLLHHVQWDGTCPDAVLFQLVECSHECPGHIPDVAPES
jgi:hypothetical protein